MRMFYDPDSTQMFYRRIVKEEFSGLETILNTLRATGGLIGRAQSMAAVSDEQGRFVADREQIEDVTLAYAAGVEARQPLDHVLPWIRFGVWLPVHDSWGAK